MHKGISGFILGMLAGLGLFWAAQVAGQNAAQAERCRTFPETGQTVCGAFLVYWEGHGGLTQQGYPISPPFTERSDLDGKNYTVQYFERAVMELHPENKGTEFEVLLAQLGTYQYRRRYPNGPPTPAITPADPWAALRARPLALPTVSGGACPVASQRVVNPDFAAALGPGPRYPVGFDAGAIRLAGAAFPAPWTGQKVLWVGDPAYSGPALVRGGRLDGGGEVRFGPGLDPAPELQLDPAAGGWTPGTWYNWPGYTRVRAPGCYAYRVDGQGFSYTIIFRAVP